MAGMLLTVKTFDLQCEIQKPSVVASASSNHNVWIQTRQIYIAGVWTVPHTMFLLVFVIWLQVSRMYVYFAHFYMNGILDSRTHF